MTNICTAFEVIKFSPADESYQTSDIQPNISRVERVAFAQCWLGLSWYNKIKAALSDTSTLPQFEVKAYSEGESVIYEGDFYTSDVNANTKSPDDGDWSPMTKFNTDSESIQLLWEEGGLKEWLCFRIFHGSVKFSHFKAGSTGLTKAGDSGDRSKITLDEFQAYKRSILKEANDALELMYIYMKEKGMITESSSECGCEGDESCKTCRPPSKRRKGRFKWLTQNNDKNRTESY